MGPDMVGFVGSFGLVADVGCEGRVDAAPRRRRAAATGIGGRQRVRVAVATFDDAEEHVDGSDKEWKFFDWARVYVKGGDGGNGCLAFRREKGVAKGGPAGGNGGDGGTVYLKADKGRNTLARFRGHIHFRADKGNNGTGKSRHGETGRSEEVLVPVGTVVYSEDGELLGDMVRDGQMLAVGKGGRGGRGNASFKSDRNVAPRLAEKGEPGQERWLRLELKLVADVGIIGVPNAGKSTLLRAVSNARPDVASYPFTTVIPTLGVCDTSQLGVDTVDSVVFADIPGLLEGAHDGRGLGTAFLRHIERCRVLVHLIAGDAEDPVGDYHAINQELELFNPSLMDKPQVVLVNKLDLPDVRENMEELREKFAAVLPHKRFDFISAATMERVPLVVKRLTKITAAQPKEDLDVLITEKEIQEREELRKAVENAFQVVREREGMWRVKGVMIERHVKMTNWDYIEAVDRFQRVLQATGISKGLKRAGAKDGDTVCVGSFEFAYFANENVFTAMAIQDGHMD